MASSSTKYLAQQLVRALPRADLGNLKSIQPKIKKKPRRSFRRGKTCGRGHKGQGQHMTLPPLGFEGGQFPFFLRIPREPYYENLHLRRQYPPFSLLQLARCIDMGRLDKSRPVDLTQLCGSNIYKIDVNHKHYGVNLTEEGLDTFTAKLNLEVQWTTEPVIAAVERVGGTITTRYYDPRSLLALIDPKRFFQRSTPIPRCRLPPQDAFEYYSDPAKRGYLARPEDIQRERLKLAEKYGYVLPDLDRDSARDMLLMRKAPWQVFYGLEPGWVVNLADKCVLKPTSPQHLEMYAS